MTETTHDSCDASERVALQRLNLSLDRAGVARYLLGKVGELRADHRPEHQDDAQCQNHSQQRRWHAAQMQTPQEVRNWGQQKGEQHSQYDWDHHLAAEIEAGDDDDRDREGQKALHAGCVGWGNLDDGSRDRRGRVWHRPILQPLARALTVARSTTCSLEMQRASASPPLAYVKPELATSNLYMTTHHHYRESVIIRGSNKHNLVSIGAQGTIQKALAAI